MNSKNILVSVAIAAYLAAVAVPFSGSFTKAYGTDGKNLNSALYAPSNGIHIGSENFPDKKFREYILSLIDADHNQYLSSSEINNTKSIDCSDQSIANLTGIQYFTALEELDCSINSISTLDLNQNKALKELRCYRNKINTLNIDECTELLFLDYDSNNLSSLSLSSNTKLKTLYCASNSISTLTLTNNTALETLGCANNSISALNLSSNTKLKSIVCDNNKLKVLSLSALSDLEYLSCGNNQLTSITLGKKNSLTVLSCKKNQLTSLELDAPKLEKLECSDNLLNSLDVSNCTSLRELTCTSNQISSLSLGTISNITNLMCNANQLTSLDLSNLSVLHVLNCFGNKIKSLDFTKCPELTNVLVGSNALTSLIVENQPVLITFDCSNNDLSSLVIRNNEQMKHVYCSDNKLASLDVSSLSELSDLDVSGNRLSSLDVSANVKLQMLYCYSNGLSYLDVSHNPLLDKLKCYGNEISSLCIGATPRLKKLIAQHPLSYDSANDYSYSEYAYDRTYVFYVDNETTINLDLYDIDPHLFPDENFRNYVSSNFDKDGNGSLSQSELDAVTIIDCPYKRIESLKGVEYFTSVTFINCYGNKLTELDVSKNTALEKLFCYSNSIQKLDLTSNTKLKVLSLHDNLVSTLNLSKCTALYSIDITNCNLTTLSIQKCTELIKLISDVPLTLSSGSVYKTSNKTYSGLDYSLKADASLIIFMNSTDIAINEKNFPDSAFRKYLFDTKDPDHTGAFSTSEANALTQIDCQGKSIKDLTGIALFPNLETLNCYNNAITGIDLQNNPKLIYFSGYGNKFTQISVRQCPYLAKLIHEATPQYTNKTVRYSSNEGYTFYYFSVDESVKILQPAWIDDKTFPDLKFRNYVSSNFDSDKNGYLDQSEISSVKKITCGSSSIATLKGVELFTELERLVCVSNQIKTLDLSENKNLTFLSCGNNSMTDLNISNCTKLSHLDCCMNSIGKLDISNCPVLVEIYTTFDRVEQTYMNYKYYEYGNETSSEFLAFDATVELTVNGLKPEKVTGLKAESAGKNKVKLTWGKVEGAEGYLVYAQKDGKYGYVGMTTKGTTFTDTKALDTDWNFYWVFAYVKDENGKMIPGGCEKYVYAKGVCLAVTGLKASRVTGGVKLVWNASSGAEGYLIYGIHPGGSYGYIGMTTKGTTFTDKKASSTDWNFYWVFPYHKNGNTMIVGGTAKYVYGKAN